MERVDSLEFEVIQDTANYIEHAQQPDIYEFDVCAVLSGIRRVNLRHYHISKFRPPAEYSEEIGETNALAQSIYEVRQQKVIPIHAKDRQRLVEVGREVYMRAVNTVSATVTRLGNEVSEEIPEHQGDISYSFFDPKNAELILEQLLIDLGTSIRTLSDYKKTGKISASAIVGSRPALHSPEFIKEIVKKHRKNGMSIVRLAFQGFPYHVGSVLSKAEEKVEELKKDPMFSRMTKLQLMAFAINNRRKVKERMDPNNQKPVVELEKIETAKEFINQFRTLKKQIDIPDHNTNAATYITKKYEMVLKLNEDQLVSSSKNMKKRYGVLFTEKHEEHYLESLRLMIKNFTIMCERLSAEGLKNFENFSTNKKLQLDVVKELINEHYEMTKFFSRKCGERLFSPSSFQCCRPDIRSLPETIELFSTLSQGRTPKTIKNAFYHSVRSPQNYLDIRDRVVQKQRDSRNGIVRPIFVYKNSSPIENFYADERFEQFSALSIRVVYERFGPVEAEKKLIEAATKKQCK